MNLIGSKVNLLRKNKKLTQEDLVAKCNLLGWNISRGTLAKIESKCRCISDAEVYLLAQALQVGVNQLYETVTVEMALQQDSP
jgi:transcriptional regulator with XRE-family HTH domain